MLTCLPLDGFLEVMLLEGVLLNCDNILYLKVLFSLAVSLSQLDS